jgi:hypothetical protein
MIQINLPTPPADDYQRRLNLALHEALGRLTIVTALLQSGSISGNTNQRTAAPTSGSWAVGDQVKNSAPAEAGSAGSKYVITGWICVSSGSPGTWKEMRCLTGN